MFTSFLVSIIGGIIGSIIAKKIIEQRFAAAYANAFRKAYVEPELKEHDTQVVLTWYDKDSEMLVGEKTLPITTEDVRNWVKEDKGYDSKFGLEYSIETLTKNISYRLKDMDAEIDFNEYEYDYFIEHLQVEQKPKAIAKEPIKPTKKTDNEIWHEQQNVKLDQSPLFRIYDK